MTRDGGEDSSNSIQLHMENAVTPEEREDKNSSVVQLKWDSVFGPGQGRGLRRQPGEVIKEVSTNTRKRRKLTKKKSKVS